MATPFGLTPQGFNAMRLSDVQSDFNAALQDQFGANINLSAESVFGQLSGIISERLALLWELAEAVYDSQYPNGAEGTSVDNILALNNLTRLQPKPTVTNPDPIVGTGGITKWGLVLFGTPGTPIPAGSIINTNATPPLAFTLDQSVTIGAKTNAVQSIFFGNTPTLGAFSLSILDTAQNTLTTSSMALVTQNTFTYSPLAAVSQILLSAPFTTSGTFKITVTQAGAALTTGAISANATPATTASNIQTALRALTGYSGVTVAVGSESASGYSYTVTWGAICNPLVTTGTNSTGITLTPMDSVQANLNNLNDTAIGVAAYPYSDVVVTGAFSTGFVCTFGSGTALGTNAASSGYKQQALITVPSNTLYNGGTATNINVSTTTTGSPGQAIGSATCSTTGPSFVGAGTLSVIGTSISGWTSVSNQLDCLTGSVLEDDTQALTRRSNELATNANGPIQAIVEKVQQVNGVTAAIGFQNLTGAAQQALTFSSIPASGHYGISINGQTTANIAYNGLASDVQTAFRALTGYSNVLVTGNSQFGFVIDFNGSNGGQAQPLATLVNNTTGVSGSIAFGRPPKSFEVVVNGGQDADVAQAIYSSSPAGIQSYGNDTVQIKDAFGNLINVSFSRPSAVPIYVTIALTTDYYNTPGSSGSGVNPNAKFNPQSVPTIQQDVIAIGNAFPIGGLIIGFGTNGLIGAFNSVPGIVTYSMNFGTNPSPGTNTNVQMQSEQIASFQQFNIVVSWT